MSMRRHLEISVIAAARQGGHEKTAGSASAWAKRLGEVGLGAAAGGTLAVATHGSRPDETLFDEALVGAGAGAALGGTVAALARQQAVRRFSNPKAYQEALTSKLMGAISEREAAVAGSAADTVAQARAGSREAAQIVKRVLGRTARARQAEDVLGPRFDSLRGKPSRKDLDAFVDGIAAREGQHPHAVLHGLSGGLQAVEARIRDARRSAREAAEAFARASSPEEALHHAQVRDYYAQVGDALQQFRDDVPRAFSEDWAHRAAVARTKLVGAREAQEIGRRQADSLRGQIRSSFRQARGAKAALAEEQARLAGFRQNPSALLDKNSPLSPAAQKSIRDYARGAEAADRAAAAERARETFFGFGG